MPPNNTGQLSRVRHGVSAMNNIVSHSTNNLKHAGAVSCKLFIMAWPTF